MIAIPAGAFDEISEVEIKLALEAFVGHRMFRQFGMVPFQLMSDIYDLHCITIYIIINVK